MSRLLILVLAGLAWLVPAQAEAIVDGEPGDLRDFPYFTVVGNGCGGALIAADRVLTAAHCLETLGARGQVRIGPERLRRTAILRAMLPLHFRELQRMEREFPPPAGDLMILKLNRPVRSVRPVKIATRESGLSAPGTSVLTIGRGAVSQDDPGDRAFRTGAVRIESFSRCQDELYTPLLRRWSLCVRDPRMDDPEYPGPFTSACFGDSGGPLLAGQGAGRELVGVVSWGAACGEERDPEIYANAVTGRAFALAARPIWAPQAIGRPRIIGRTTPGRSVSCNIRWRRRPTHNIEFSFVLNGMQVQSGRRNRYLIHRGDRGKRISCDGGGSTAGGRGGTFHLSPARLIR